MYQYIMLNAWLMPCTLPGTHNRETKGTQVHTKKNTTYLTATTLLTHLLTHLTMTNLNVYCGQSHY